jgi:integrase/recombinase XerC
MLEHFIQYLSFEKRYSPHTIGAYEHDVQQFIDFAELTSKKDFQEVNSFLVRGWIVQLIDDGISNRSVNRKLASLRTYFKWLRKEGEITTNPLAKLQGPKNEKRLPIFVKESELDQAKTSILFSTDFNGVRDELMFELFYQTGIRLSELIGLKDSDVSEQHIKVLGKRNKERLIPISNQLSQSIQLFRTMKRKMGIDSLKLVTRENGMDLYPSLVYRKINVILETLTTSDKKSPHVLRHTFATHLLNRGTGLETLKDLLGHANLSATQVYTHNSFAQLTAVYAQAHPRGIQKTK